MKRNSRTHLLIARAMIVKQRIRLVFLCVWPLLETRLIALARLKSPAIKSVTTAIWHCLCWDTKLTHVLGLDSLWGLTLSHTYSSEFFQFYSSQKYGDWQSQSNASTIPFIVFAMIKKFREKRPICLPAFYIDRLQDVQHWVASIVAADVLCSDNGDQISNRFLVMVGSLVGFQLSTRCSCCGCIQPVPANSLGLDFTSLISSQSINISKDK